jgi:hypothetical protein
VYNPTFRGWFAGLPGEVGFGFVELGAGFQISRAANSQEEPLSQKARTRLVAALASALASAACAGSAPSDDPTTTPDGGMAVMVGPCNDLENDAPQTHPSCTCTGCPTSGTAAMKDGTYTLKTMVNYTTDCQTLAATTNIRGKLRVTGNTLDLIMEQPSSAAGDTFIERMRYTYQLSNGVLTVQWVCPPADGGLASQVIGYNSDGKSLHFATLPGTQGDTLFGP